MAKDVSREKMTNEVMTERQNKRRKRYGKDVNRKEEYASAESLSQFRESVEEYFGRDFFAVMEDALEVNLSFAETARILCLYVKCVRDPKVNEEEFVKSHYGKSLLFDLEALESMATAVKTAGKTPIIWRIDCLCRR